MDNLKFPDWDVPPQKNEPLSMDQYLDFVLFCRKAFPPKNPEFRTMPAPVRFVIREKDDPFPEAPHKT